MRRGLIAILFLMAWAPVWGGGIEYETSASLSNESLTAVSITTETFNFEMNGMAGVATTTLIQSGMWTMVGNSSANLIDCSCYTLDGSTKSLIFAVVKGTDPLDSATWTRFAQIEVSSRAIPHEVGYSPLTSLAGNVVNSREVLSILILQSSDVPADGYGCYGRFWRKPDEN